VGEERKEDPVVLASYQDAVFLSCPICYGRGGDVALGWTHICLGRRRSRGAQLGFGVGAGGVERVVCVHKLCLCALVKTVNHELCTTQCSYNKHPVAGHKVWGTGSQKRQQTSVAGLGVSPCQVTGGTAH